MAKIHDKNYDNQDLTIDAYIWNDNKINGGDQMILITLIRKFTKNGKQPCQALTLQLAKLLHSHEKNIKYHLQQLHQKGFIELYQDNTSKTGISIRYTYKIEDKVQPESPGLF